MRADFHIHTSASDGLCTPQEVVFAAKSANVGAISVTDHDTVYNLPYAKAECEKLGLSFVGGVEISAYEGDVKVHTLGFGVKEEGEFAEFIKKLYDGSFERCADILSKFKKQGIELTVEECAAQRPCKEVPVHSMHICRAAVKKGYATNPYLFYQKYLNYGAPCFSLACRPTPEEAIEAVNSCGGMAVIAHPGRISLGESELKLLIKKLAQRGLGGIEAVYSTHTDLQTAYFKELAGELNLHVTGGSDFHAFGTSKKIGTPPFYPSADLRQILKI